MDSSGWNTAHCQAVVNFEMNPSGFHEEWEIS